MVIILVSSCLLGINCKYNGQNNNIDNIKELLKDYEIIEFCPEVSGGLSIPRVPCEICGDKVINKLNVDCTNEFNLGAQKCLDLCIKHNIKKAVLKEKSPSCGVNYIYDGSFTGTLKQGCGVTTNLLKSNGIEVINEEELN